MRIKLSHLIIVSLITLSFVFSAISNANAGYTGGYAMGGSTTDGGVMEDNTTGGTWTVYLDNDEKPTKQDCLDRLDIDLSTCELLYGKMGLDMPHLLNVCVSDTFDDYEDCRCAAGDGRFCPGGGFYRPGIPKYSSESDQPPYVVDEMSPEHDIFYKYQQPVGNAKVDDQVAPDKSDTDTSDTYNTDLKSTTLYAK
jgi:hypothetical protein